MDNEISREDLFRKIDRLKIRIFDTEDALKSAEIRIQELNKCNDYANEELERYKNIIDDLETYLQRKYCEYIDMESDDAFVFSLVLDTLRELKGSDE